MGAAMLAMVACGVYDSVKSVCGELVSISSVVEPEAALVAKYEKRYQQFREIYPTCKGLFKNMAKE